MIQIQGREKDIGWEETQTEKQKRIKERQEKIHRESGGEKREMEKMRY